MNDMIYVMKIVILKYITEMHNKNADKTKNKDKQPLAP